MAIGSFFGPALLLHNEEGTSQQQAEGLELVWPLDGVRSFLSRTGFGRFQAVFDARRTEEEKMHANLASRISKIPVTEVMSQAKIPPLIFLLLDINYHPLTTFTN